MRKQIRVASVPIVRIFHLRTHSKRSRITRPIVKEASQGEKSGLVSGCTNRELRLLHLLFSPLAPAAAT